VTFKVTLQVVAARTEGGKKLSRYGWLFPVLKEELFRASLVDSGSKLSVSILRMSPVLRVFLEEKHLEEVLNLMKIERLLVISVESAKK